VLFIYTRLQILAAKPEQRKNKNKETKKIIRSQEPKYDMKALLKTGFTL